MRELSVDGLTPDGLRLVVRVLDGEPDEVFELPLSAVRVAQQRALAAAAAARPVPTPRQMQDRVRRGESPEDIAKGSGLPVEVVERYARPVLAERAHQAERSRRSVVDGRPVEEAVGESLKRLAPGGPPPEWDSWLREDGSWEVVATSGERVVRLKWDATSRKTTPLDDSGRQALRGAPLAEDALTAVVRPPAQDALSAVLRPVSGGQPAPAAPPTSVPRRKGRASVPLWSEISTQVAGRGPEQDQP